MKNINNITINLDADGIDNKFIYFKCPICYKSEHSRKHATHTVPSYNNRDLRLEVHPRICNTMPTVFFLNVKASTKGVRRA